MSAPFNCRRPAGNGTTEDALIMAARDGDLELLKDIIKTLGDGNGGQAAVLSIKQDGMGVLHWAACAGKQDICKYLVDELGLDVNMIGAGGITPLMCATHSDDLPTVKYLVECGGDLMTPDEKGRTVLHHAAGLGFAQVTGFLLSKGIPVDKDYVDKDYGCGTALCDAAINGHLNTCRILVKHKANVNASYNGIITPMMGAVVCHSTMCMKFLHKLGMLPPELAALNGSVAEVKMLLPKTKPIPGVEWTLDGVMTHAQDKGAWPPDEQGILKRKARFLSEASNSFELKEYEMASKLYGLVINHSPDANLYSKRSLSRLLMGDGQGALDDAKLCMIEKPGWAKGFYLQAAAYLLLRDHNEACNSLLDAHKLDPETKEVDDEMRNTLQQIQSVTVQDDVQYKIKSDDV